MQVGVCGENGRGDTDMSIKETRCIVNIRGTVNCVIENSEKMYLRKTKNGHAQQRESQA